AFCRYASSRYLFLSKFPSEHHLKNATSKENHSSAPIAVTAALTVILNTASLNFSICMVPATAPPARRPSPSPEEFVGSLKINVPVIIVHFNQSVAICGKALSWIPMGFVIFPEGGNVGLAQITAAIARRASVANFFIVGHNFVLSGLFELVQINPSVELLFLKISG